jgi:hypothetical protein
LSSGLFVVVGGTSGPREREAWWLRRDGQPAGMT